MFLEKRTEVLFFPLQWTRACLSLDSNARKVRLVVDGQLLGEEEYKREEDEKRPTNISLLLGAWDYEYPVKIADLNVFNSSLSVERMVGMTQAGDEECGAAGDLVSWEEAEWSLHSQAKVIEVDLKWEGACRRESKVHVFQGVFRFHHDCMQHCQKIAGGDAFVGAFCHGLLEGWSLPDTIRYGNAAGAIVAGRMMCADDMPTGPEVDAFLQERDPR